MPPATAVNWPKPCAPGACSCRPLRPSAKLAERIFQELRRAIQGRVYASLDAKQAAMDTALRDLAAAPERIRQLCGYPWFRAAISNLPTSHELRQL